MSRLLELPGLERGVWCISEPGHTGAVIGSGFFVAPDTFLTCAHVVESVGELCIRNAVGDVEYAVDDIELAPNSGAMDVALLTVKNSPKPVFACSTEQSDGSSFRSRGFSSAAPSGRTSELNFRGPIRAHYSKGQTDYEIAAALEFAGDMGSPGNSGAPILAHDLQAVVAIVCAGDIFEERTWAISLSDAAAAFPSLHRFLAWNRRNIPAFGQAINRLGVEAAIASASKLALQRMREVKEVENTKIVPRVQAAQSVKEFLDSEPTTASVVGFSGIGKSWFLIDLVERAIVKNGVLIAAADLASANLKPLQAQIHESVASELNKIDQDIGLPSAEKLDDAISQMTRPLTVLVDGINEASDSPGFLNSWIPEAARWCKKVGGKLIISCRPELWPTAYDAFQDPKRDLFMQPRMTSEISQEERTSRMEPSSKYQISLADFSSIEAMQARQIYGLPENTEKILMGNPLLYRISRRLLSEGEIAADGTVATLRRYAKTLLNDVYARGGWKSPRVLFDALGSFADKAYVSDNLSIPKHWAYSQFGDRNVIDALLASGLLVGYDEGFRFVYDDLVGALATVSITTDEMFFGERAYQPEFQARDIESLMRLEADGPEADFQHGLEQLAIGLRGMSAYVGSLSGEIQSFVRFEKGENAWQLLTQVIRLARSLPTSRRPEIESIFSQFLHVADLAVARWGIDELVNLISEAPISVLARAKLLLGIAPYSDAWPLRHKDWVDQSRREDYFEKNIKLGIPSTSVAPALYNLCASNARELFPLLASHLTDGTEIDRGESDDSRGEATVSSMVGGLLFISRSGHVSRLIDYAILGWSPSGRFLAEALAESDSLEVSGHIVRLLDDWSAAESAAYPLLQTLCWCAPRLDSEAQREVFEAAEALQIDKELGKRTQIQLLRAIAPDDVRVWDLAAEFSVESGDQYVLEPIPVQRLEAFLNHCEAAPGNYLHVLKRIDGEGGFQSSLAKRAKGWLAEGKLSEKDFGSLVENRLYPFARASSPPDEQVWLAVAQELIDTHRYEARRYLIHPLTWNIEDPLATALKKLEDSMVKSGLTEGEFDAFKKKLLPIYAPWESQEWVRRTRQVRSHNLKAWDEFMLVRYGFYPERREALADYWAKLVPLERSDIASEVVSSIESGADTQETFDTVVSRFKVQRGME